MEGLPYCTTQGNTTHIDSAGIGERLNGAGVGVGCREGLKLWHPGLWLRSLCHCAVMGKDHKVGL